jgi:hypothetical protein
LGQKELTTEERKLDREEKGKEEKRGWGVGGEDGKKSRASKEVAIDRIKIAT